MGAEKFGGAKKTNEVFTGWGEADDVRDFREEPSKMIDYRIDGGIPAQPDAPSAEQDSKADELLAEIEGLELTMNAANEPFNKITGEATPDEPTTEQLQTIAELAKNNEGDNAQYIGAGRKLHSVPTKTPLKLVDTSLGARDIPRERNGIDMLKPTPENRPTTPTPKGSFMEQLSSRSTNKPGFFGKLFGGGK